MEKYNEIVMEILNNYGIKQTPAFLVGDWEEFVNECIDGYYFSIYDYDNSLALRDRIELLLEQPVLQQYGEYKIFTETVNKIDFKFKSILHQNFKRNIYNKWWWEGILKYSGQEYYYDIKSIYGYEIQEIN